jgi:cell division protein FtsB
MARNHFGHNRHPGVALAQDSPKRLVCDAGHGRGDYRKLQIVKHLAIIPGMGEKIKSIAGIFLRGLFASWRGMAGAALIVFSLYLFTGFFTGTTNVQNYVRNARELGQIDAKIAAVRAQLDATNSHIRLIQEHSPDFVSEMASKHLNLGDPKIMILKK